MTVDLQLSRRIVPGDPNAAKAVLDLFERHDPTSLDQAVALVTAFGLAPEEIFDEIAEGWSHYRLMRDMPWD